MKTVLDRKLLAQNGVIICDNGEPLVFLIKHSLTIIDCSLLPRTGNLRAGRQALETGPRSVLDRVWQENAASQYFLQERS